MVKWIVILVLAVILVSIGTLGVVFATSPGAREALSKRFFPESRTAVRYAIVTKGDLVRTINAPGSIEPKTKVQISAQVVARIIDLPFREGDNVKKGDVVVRLDARDLAAAVESSQANLAGEQARLRGSEAQLVQASNELERSKKLFSSKDVARNTLDDAEANALRAQSAVDATKQSIAAARAGIVRAQKDLENTVISATFDGTIVKLNAEVGELVLVGTLNNAASVIMEIADLGTMLMKARVDEANIAPVRAGQGCRVYINAYRDRNFDASVERVGLKRLIDRDGTGYFEVEILVSKPKDIVLASGLTSNVDIRVETFPGVLKLPTQAIIDRRFDTLPQEVRSSVLVDKSKAFTRVVFIDEAGKVRAKPVVSGASDLTDTVVLAGLNEGDKVIAGPFKALVDLNDGKLVVDEAIATKEKEIADRAKLPITGVKETDKEKDKEKENEKEKDKEKEKDNNAKEADAAEATKPALGKGK